MTRTSPLVDFSIYDPAIKQDSTPSCTDIQSFSKVADLEIPSDVQVYGSYEPDFWLLDGRYKLMPTATTNVHVGWMSLSMSDAAGAFASPPTLTVTFTTNQTVTGLTLKFSQYTGDWCDDLDVAYYNSSDVLIQTNNHTPTSHEIYTATACAAFRKIIITFNSTNKPYRYLRLLSIDYGKVIHFTSADIKSCVVTEEINPISIELPIDTLELTIFSSDANFSVVNPAGDFASLQNNQPFYVYETIGNDIVYINTFYLDTWNSISDNVIEFGAYDLIGILDKTKTVGMYFDYDDGFISLVDLLSLLLGTNNIPYVLHDTGTSLSGLWIKGILPPCNLREALRQICFSIRAQVTTSRFGYIDIAPSVIAADLIAFDYTILAADKGIKQSINLKPIVNGIDIVRHKITVDQGGAEIIFSLGVLAAGNYTVSAKNNLGLPVGALHPYNCTVTSVDQRNMTITINVPSLNSVQIGYNALWRIDEIVDSVLYPVAGFISNTILIDNSIFISAVGLANLVDADNVTAAQRVYDYLQQRYIQKVILYNPEITIGSSVIVDVAQGLHLYGVVEKMRTNLHGGFVSDVEIVGVVAA